MARYMLIGEGLSCHVIGGYLGLVPLELRTNVNPKHEALVPWISGPTSGLQIRSTACPKHGSKLTGCYGFSGLGSGFRVWVQGSGFRLVGSGFRVPCYPLIKAFWVCRVI